MELNQLDYNLIYKSKIDATSIFKSHDYNFEFCHYIIFLINTHKDIPKKYLDEISNDERYHKWPSMQSLCYDILFELVKKSVDIENEKYENLLLGLQNSDSITMNFIRTLINLDLNIPESFYYMFDDDAAQSFFTLESMVDLVYTKPVPDIILKSIIQKEYYIKKAVEYILENDATKIYFKHIDFFISSFVDKFKKILEESKDKFLEMYESQYYLNYLKDILFIFRVNRDVINPPKILIEFLKSKEFYRQIKSYYKQNLEKMGEYPEIKEYIDEILNSKIKESFSFKQFFISN